MLTLSPGLAQGCFELLEITRRTSLRFSEIKHSFARIGVLSAEMVVEATQRLNWLKAGDDDGVRVTELGERILDLTRYEERLRQALLDYIDIERPPWIQNAIYGRSRVLAFTGTELAQVFVEADLSHGLEDDVVRFWDEISARARGLKQDRTTAIGRVGERLTLQYEQARTGRMAKWVSVDNNADGYDVLSVVHTADLRPFSIEVKASTSGLSGRFHLTRNEWQRAEDYEMHCFHLWDISREEVPRVAVIPARVMSEHIPADRGTGCWEQVEIPFSFFRECFFASQTLSAETE